MSFQDLISLVWSNLRRARGRVLMTALGVAIGTAAVIVLVSLGAGLQRQAQESLMSGAGMTQLRVNAPVNFLTDLNDPTMPRGRDLGTPSWTVIDDRALAEFRGWEEVVSVQPVESLMAQTKVTIMKVIKLAKYMLATSFFEIRFVRFIPPERPYEGSFSYESVS